MTRKTPVILRLQLPRRMIEEAMNDYERENPGQSASAMSSKEMADRVMKKLYASAEIIEGGNA